MAKKKSATLDDVLKLFTGVMQRASLTSYYNVNQILLSKNDLGHRILVIPDPEIWDLIITDCDIKELDLQVKEQHDELTWFQYGEDLVDNWIPIDVNEDLFGGKVFKIRIKDVEYQVPITKDLMPLKLRKNEYDNISYRTFYQKGKDEYIGHNVVARTPQRLILTIKKRFEIPEVSGFTIIRLFQVI